MKIEITCDDNATFATTVVIHSLDFEPKEKTFSMQVPMGDDWLGQKVRCPVDATPVSVHLEQGLTRIHFEHYKDAAAFGAWLIDGDAHVQHGFRTMRG
jgi:hypothetical protein